MSSVRITLYGGVNEIGGNKFLLEDGEDRLLLDFGMSIGARSEWFQEFLKPRTNSALRDLLRLDLLPRIDGIYRDDLLTVARATTDRDLPESAAEWRKRHEGAAFAHGILVTHAHVDHFQDLSWVDPDIPVHLSPTTARMLEAIQDVGKVDVDNEIVEIRTRSVGRTGATSTFPDTPKIENTARPRTLCEFAEDETFDVGPFRVQPIPVDHSVPGACAFLIRTPSGKRVFYTGDVRFHGRLMDRTATLRKAAEGMRPDVMLTEGTRIYSDEQDGEADVERGIHDLVEGADGLVIAEFGWKDTTRFDTLQRVAEQTGRTLLVDPRLGYLHRKLVGPISQLKNTGVYVRRRESMLDSPGDYEKHELGYKGNWGAKEMKKALADKNEAELAEALVHFRSGVRAAKVREAPQKYIVHLSFWSILELMDLDPQAGSRWIRCATEPYNDDMADDLAKQARWLQRFGVQHNVNPDKNHPDAPLRGRTHISGHGSGVDLKKLINAVEPVITIPVHTSKDKVSHFDGTKGEKRTFPNAGYQDAARGRCIVEL